MSPKQRSSVSPKHVCGVECHQYSKQMDEFPQLIEMQVFEADDIVL